MDIGSRFGRVRIMVSRAHLLDPELAQRHLDLFWVWKLDLEAMVNVALGGPTLVAI